MVIKTIVALMMLVVLFGLFRALYFLVTQKGDKAAVVRSLGLRVAASVAIIILLLIAKFAGLLEPRTMGNLRADTVPHTQEAADAASGDESSGVLESVLPPDPYARRRAEDDDTARD